MKISKRKIFALLITLGLLVVVFYKIDWGELLNTFKDFNFKNIWLIVPLYVLTLYLRGVRWKALLLNNAKYSSLHLGEVFTVGSMLNIFLPARAGDVYRAYYLGSVKGEKKMKVFGSIILERTLDGISVFLMLFLAVLLYCRQDWILHIAYGIRALFVGSLVAFYVIFKFNKIDAICAGMKNFVLRFNEKVSAPLVKFIDNWYKPTNKSTLYNVWHIYFNA